MSHAEVGQGIPIDSVQRYGGVVPGIDEIVRRVLAARAHRGGADSEQGDNHSSDHGARS